VIAFTGQLEVDSPPLVVFELLADMAELHRWNPNVRTSRRISGDRLAPGSTYESIIARGPVRMTAHSELVTVEPGRKVEYEGSIAWFWSIDSLTFEASGDGTRITFRNETKTPRWLSPLTPLLNASFQRQARRAVEGAARYLADAFSGG
jgi:uncharacterized protein YndB with AHSA1/START domain